MEIIKKAEVNNIYSKDFARKASCVGCYCDTQNCGTCSKILK